MKFRRFSHLLLPFAHLKCLCVAARYKFVKKYVRFFQMHISNSEGSSVVVKIKMSHVIVSFSIKPFGKHFLHNKKTFYSWRRTSSILGGNPFLHSGRSIRTIYEAQHRRLPACSRKYWELFMKNNIDCFLCDVPNMGLPAHSVSVVDFIHNSPSGEKYFEIA